MNGALKYIIIILFVSVVLENAEATQCFKNPVGMFAKAEAIFEGEVISEEKVTIKNKWGTREYPKYEWKILKSWKGPKEGIYYAFTQGQKLTIKNKYIVFTNYNNNISQLVTYECNLSELPEDRRNFQQYPLDVLNKIPFFVWWPVKFLFLFYRVEEDILLIPYLVISWLFIIGLGYFLLKKIGGRYGN